MSDIQDVKVYRMNENYHVASKWGPKETNAWFEEKYCENDIEEVEEVDIDEAGMYIETKDEEDIRLLGKETSVKTEQGIYLARREGIPCKYVTFREALLTEFGVDFQEPFIISSEE